MQLGFVSAILPDLSLAEVLSFAAATGYGAVEVMCWPPGKAERRYAGVTHIDVVDFTRADAARVHELTAQTGVALSGLGYYPNPLTPDAAEAQVYVEHIKRVILAAELLGLPVVNTFIGRDWRLSVDANWPRFLGHVAAARRLCCGSRRQDRHRELPYALHHGRMAGREKSGHFPGDLAAHVRRHSQRELRPQL